MFTVNVDWIENGVLSVKSFGTLDEAFSHFEKACKSFENLHNSDLSHNRIEPITIYMTDHDSGSVGAFMYDLVDWFMCERKIKH